MCGLTSTAQESLGRLTLCVGVGLCVHWTYLLSWGELGYWDWWVLREDIITHPPIPMGWICLYQRGLNVICCFKHLVSFGPCFYCFCCQFTSFQQSPPRHLQYIFLKRFYIMSTFTYVRLTDKIIATSRPVVHAQQNKIKFKRLFDWATGEKAAKKRGRDGSRKRKENSKHDKERPGEKTDDRKGVEDQYKETEQPGNKNGLPERETNADTIMFMFLQFMLRPHENAHTKRGLT